jgi:phosphoribosylformylglycinamidine cyclo-ligase
VLLGGETAVLPGVVSGIDVVCTVLAIRVVTTRHLQPGDVLIGYPPRAPTPTATACSAGSSSRVRRSAEPAPPTCSSPR